MSTSATTGTNWVSSLSLPYSNLDPSSTVTWRGSGFGQVFLKHESEEWDKQVWPSLLGEVKNNHKNIIKVLSSSLSPPTTTASESSSSSSSNTTSSSVAVTDLCPTGEWLVRLLQARDSNGEACIHFVARGPLVTDIDSMLYSSWSSEKQMVAPVIRMGKRYQQMLLALLKLGMDVDLPFADASISKREADSTPLMLALSNCWLPAVLVLLQQGASTQASNAAGATPLTFALRGMSAWGQLSNLRRWRDTHPHLREDREDDPRLYSEDLLRHLHEMQLDCIDAASTAIAPLGGISASLQPASSALQDQFTEWIREGGSETDMVVATERLRADWLSRAVCELVWRCPKAALTDRRYCLQCHVWCGHRDPNVCLGPHRSFLELLRIESRAFVGQPGMFLLMLEDDMAIMEAESALDEIISSQPIQNELTGTRSVPSASLLRQVHRGMGVTSTLLSALAPEISHRLSPIPYPAQLSGVRCGLRRRIYREAMLVAAFCGAKPTADRTFLPSGIWSNLPADLLRGPIAAFLWG